MLSTDRHTNRQKITIQIRSGQSDSPNARHTDKPRNDKTRANNWHIRKNACLAEDFVKISTGERRPMWHKYVQIAVMNYNTSYHESFGCEPTTVFHGRIPYNILDIKLGLKPEWKKDNNEELKDELQKQIAEIHQAAKENLMQLFLK